MPQNTEHKRPVNASQTVVAGKKGSTWLPGREPNRGILLVIPFHFFIQLSVLLLHRESLAKKTFRRHREKLGWICGAISTQHGVLTLLQLSPKTFKFRLHHPRPIGIPALARRP